LNKYQYQINTDNIIFIIIARKYLQGEFFKAINSFWQPLMSWLLVPFLALPIKPLLASKFLSILIGLFTLCGLRKLSFNLEISGQLRGFIMFFFAPLISWHALSISTADLLSTGIIIYYLTVVFDDTYKRNYHKATLCGLLVGLASLAREYNLSFFILHFSLINLIYYFKAISKEAKKRILINTLVGFLSCFFIYGSWVAVRSSKYHKLLIFPTASYSFGFIKPDSKGQIFEYGGFIRQSDDAEIYCTDEYYFRDTQKWHWSPFKSRKDLIYEIKNIFKNGGIYFMGVLRNPLSFLGLIYIIWSLFFLIKRPFKVNEKLSLFMLTIVLYPLGYLFIMMHNRYVQVSHFLLIMAGGQALGIILSHKFLNKAKRLAILIIIFIFMLIPIFRDAYSKPNIGKEFYDLSEQGSSYYEFKEKKIASQHGAWQEGFFLSFYWDSKYFGQSPEEISDEQLWFELKSFNIDYYLVKGVSNNNLKNLVLERKLGILSLYKVLK
ncbi:MAG: hypothetical protein V1490_02205, partial [Candidatus Omnitrophota bacterium]